jgi:hypothetical protein
MGPDEFTKNPTVNVRIDYQDSISPPWYGTNGRAANLVCLSLGATCTQASDAVSGVAGGFTWNWGDNTAGGSGATAAHTFTAPGTYQVVASGTDGAGNFGTGTKVITVQPASTGGGTGAGTGTVSSPSSRAAGPSPRARRS